VAFSSRYNNSLNGSIPSNIGAASSLTTIYLNLNNISGELPESICNLTQLQYITISRNSISGSIPTNIGLLQKVYFFSFFANAFSGTIPESMGNMTMLQFLYLSSLRLNGTIPASLGGLPALKHLDVFGNMLTGSIPSSLGKLNALERLLVMENRLSSTIPWSLGNCSSLLRLDLSNNALTGPVPVTLARLSLLNSLKLGQNQLSGSLPDEIGQLSKLQLLNVSGNTLGGILPAALARLSALQVFDGSGNRFFGSLRSVMTAAPSGSAFVPAYVNISLNSFSGLFPSLPTLAGGGGSVATLRVTSFFDVSGAGSVFDCPIPPYDQAKTALLREPCRPNYDTLIYICQWVGGVLLGAILALALTYQLAPAVAKHPARLWVAFFLSWIVGCVSLYVDAFALNNMLVYLGSTVDNCAPMNQYAVWISLMPYFPQAGPIAAGAPFARWMREYMTWASGSVTTAFPPARVQANVDAFAALCLAIRSGCGVRWSPEFTFYEPATVYASECFLAAPEQSPFGGGSHRVFYALVIAIAAVRALIECMRIVAVLIMVWLGRPCGPVWVPDFVGSSVAAPLLYFARTSNAARRRSLSSADISVNGGGDDSSGDSSGDADFRHIVIYRMASFRELIFRIVHQCLLSSLPVLIANFWYLQVVQQSGVEPLTILSVVFGLLTIPALLVRACHARSRDDHSWTDVELAAHVEAQMKRDAAAQMVVDSMTQLNLDEMPSRARAGADADAGQEEAAAAAGGGELDPKLLQSAAACAASRSSSSSSSSLSAVDLRLLPPGIALQRASSSFSAHSLSQLPPSPSPSRLP
jgi:hypothetical protein